MLYDHKLFRFQSTKKRGTPGGAPLFGAGMRSTSPRRAMKLAWWLNATISKENRFASSPLFHFALPLCLLCGDPPLPKRQKRGTPEGAPLFGAGMRSTSPRRAMKLAWWLNATISKETASLPRRFFSIYYILVLARGGPPLPKRQKRGTPEGAPLFGAGSGGRTRTVSLPLDFESSTSANSIIPANASIIAYPEGENQVFFHILQKNRKAHVHSVPCIDYTT